MLSANYFKLLREPSRGTPGSPMLSANYFKVPREPTGGIVQPFLTCPNYFKLLREPFSAPRGFLGNHSLVPVDPETPLPISNHLDFFFGSKLVSLLVVFYSLAFHHFNQSNEHVEMFGRNSKSRRSP